MKRKAEFSTKNFWHKISGYMGSLDAIESTLNIEFSTHTLSYFGHLTRNSLYVYTLLPLGIISDYDAIISTGLWQLTKPDTISRAEAQHALAF